MKTLILFLLLSMPVLAQAPRWTAIRTDSLKALVSQVTMNDSITQIKIDSLLNLEERFYESFIRQYPQLAAYFQQRSFWDGQIEELRKRFKK